MAIDSAALAALPFFARLTAEQRRAVSLVLVERAFSPGTVIFAEGTPGMACAFVIEGLVHAELEIAGGRRERINTMGSGEIFGEISLIDGGARSASCVVGEGGARVALLSRADFGLLFDAGNPFAFSMVRFISRQLARRVQRATRVWGEAARAGESVRDR